MKRIKVLGLLFVALLLISCGGGGGGGDTSDTPVVDGPWLCFTAGSSHSAVSIHIAAYGQEDFPLPVLEYSTDGINWKSFVIDDTIVYLNKTGDRVYIRAVSTNTTFSYYDSSVYPSVYRFISFSLGGTIAASGNVMSLLDRDCKTKTIPCDGCFSHLFYWCENLTTAPDLPATTLTERCYHRMFDGCTSLKVAPELPAAVMKYMCYSSMFDGCTSLKTTPKLPATVMANMCYFEMFNGCTSLTTTVSELPAITLDKLCYSGMFGNCVSLVTAPELPATTLADECYEGMFAGCSSLVTAPELPATTLAKNCYENMFSGCASLTTAPELPATTLAVRSYWCMFYDCTSLTTAPELSAITLEQSCYGHMFHGCSSLTYIKVHFKDWMNSAIEWMEGVPSGGEFHCRTGFPTAGSGIDFPDGWTAINDVPEPTP